MIVQRKVILDFPDDGGDSINALHDALPQHHAFGLVGSQTGWFRLRGLAARDQVFLLMAVSGLGTPATEPLLNPDELQVPFHARAAVEQALISCGGRGGVWTEPYRLRGDAGAVTAFETLWMTRILSRL